MTNHEKQMAAIPDVLAKFIATRDRKQKHPVTATPLRETFEELLHRGRVEVGGRSSCGGATDPTWKMFTAWNEIVKKASALGFHINTHAVKHGNKSPTMAQGYWYSNIYELVKKP